MSVWLRCDICDALAREEYAVGWKNVQHLTTVISYGEQPVEHLCLKCWTKMMKAVEQ